MSVDTMEMLSASHSQSESVKATVYTSYYARLLKNHEARGELMHIGVSRYWPRWIKRPPAVRWLPNLGPSKRLLFGAKEVQMPFEEYGRRYLHEITSNRAGIEALNWVGYLLEQGLSVVLYCYEKDVYSCHRFWLAEFLSQRHGSQYTGELIIR